MRALSLSLIISLMASLFLAYGANALTFNSALVDAADLGDQQKVLELLKGGHDPGERGDFGVSPLMRAAFRGYTDIVIILAESGAYIDAADIGGATALHLAARNGHAKTVEKLLEYDAFIDIPDKEKWTPLMRAIMAKQSEVVHLLVAKGADVSISNEIDESPVIHAASVGKPDIMEAISRAKNFRKVSEDHITTALRIAEKKNHDYAAKILEINLNKANNRSLSDTRKPDKTIIVGDNLFGKKFNPEPELKERSPQKPAKTVDDYVRDGTIERSTPKSPEITQNRQPEPEKSSGEYPWFQPSAQQSEFTDPLIAAADQGDLYAVRSLLESGRNPDVRTKNGVTALMRAAARGSIDVIEAIIESGAYIDGSDIKGMSALHFAAKNGHASAVKILLYYNALVDVPDVKKRTPIVHAALRKNLDIVRILADKGADVSTLSMLEKEKPQIAKNIPAPILKSPTKPLQPIDSAGNYDQWQGWSDGRKNQHNILPPKNTSTQQFQNLEIPPSITANNDSLDYDTYDDPANISKKATFQQMPDKYFLLQLGSFENKDQALYVWDRLRQKYIDVLVGLKPDIIEAFLAQQQIMVYRLRAGYFVRKNAAVAACNDLRNYNIECFVVETSSNEYMFAKSDIDEIPQQNNVETPKPTSEPVYIDQKSFAPENIDESAPVPTDNPRYASLTPKNEYDDRPWLKESPTRKEWNLPETVINSFSIPLPTVVPAPYPVINVAPEYSAPQQYTAPDQFANANQYQPPPPENYEELPLDLNKLDQPIYPYDQESAPYQQQTTNIAPGGPQLQKTPGYLYSPEERQKLAEEVRELARKEFFEKQGGVAQKRTNQPFQDPSPFANAPVSEAVLVPDDTYFVPSYGNNPYQQNSYNSGNSWINAGGFASKREADDYSDRMFRYDEDLQGAQIMVNRDSGNGFRGSYAIKAGPVGSDTAQNMCSAVRASGYNCSASSKPGAAAAQAPSYNNYQPQTASQIPTNERYNPNFANKSRQTRAPMPSFGENYWINLGTFSDVPEAEYYWMFLLEDHEDILSRMKYDVPKAAGHGEFGPDAVLLKIGPFNVKERASQICNVLHYRNVACLVGD